MHSALHKEHPIKNSSPAGGCFPFKGQFFGSHLGNSFLGFDAT